MSQISIWEKISSPRSLRAMNCSFMSARAPLYSSSLTPKAPPDVSSQKKFSGYKHRCPFHFRIRVRISSRECCSVFRVSALPSSGKRGGGKVWADVKSKPCDIPSSGPDSVKLEEEELDSSVAWLDRFPKRWVIVVLCFSAFLLCNMDRVSSFTKECQFSLF